MPISQHSTPAPPDPGHLIAQARDGFAELDQIFTILTSLIDQRSVGYQLARDGRRLAERHHAAMQTLPPPSDRLTTSLRTPYAHSGGRHG
ncbi:hypothetical protein [Andreprevotia chitinilytica]|uniref:hypothetical protein n=1 Tax=Andreprevotia chitinilytica TaxID=396808 RepID=UPI0012EBBAF0|nr:hypothetical protein [Andreprevotia chitinilytica]